MADRLAEATKAQRDALAALDKAKKRKAVADQAVKEASDRIAAETRPGLAAAIVEAAKEGRRTRDIVAITGYTRERVRQICRQSHVELSE